MKNIPLFLLLFLGINLSIGQEAINLENQNLPDGVLKVIEHSLMFTPKGKLRSHTLTTDTFGKNGQLLKRIKKPLDPSLNDENIEIINSYSEDGKRLLKQKKMSNGKVENLYEFSYNDKNQLILIKEISGKKKNIQNVYDSKGRLVEEKTYVNNVLKSKKEITYDRNRKTQKKSFYDKNSVLTRYISSKYKNNIEESSKVVRLSPSSENVYIFYVYDQNDNLIDQRVGKQNDISKSKSQMISNYKYDKNRVSVADYSDFTLAKEFIFRKVIYKDGTISGSNEIDKKFIAEYVDLAKLSIFKSNDVLVKRPNIAGEKYIYNFVKVGESNKNYSGEIWFRSTGEIKLQGKANIRISSDVLDFKSKLVTLWDKKETNKDYSWDFLNNLDESYRLLLFKNPVREQGKKFVGLFFEKNKGSNSVNIYYLEESKN